MNIQCLRKTGALTPAQAHYVIYLEHEINFMKQFIVGDRDLFFSKLCIEVLQLGASMHTTKGYKLLVSLMGVA